MTVKDLDLIQKIDLLKERENIICGSSNYVRKAYKLLFQAGFQVTQVYTDDCISDEELSYAVVKPLREIYGRLDKDGDAINVILAENNPRTSDDILLQLEEAGVRYVFTYYALYIAMSAAVCKGKVQNSDMLCMDEMNHAIGICDAVARWIKGIRWVEESRIPLLLYAMPKTGTQAMKASLLNKGLEHTYVHYLNLEYPLFKQYNQCFDERMPTMANVVHNLEEIKENYLENLKKKRIKIITSVREPIARGYSEIFQSITNWGIYPIIKSAQGDFLEGTKNYLMKCWESTFEWFDYEIKSVLGIDVYEYPFDQEKGYSIIKKDNIEIFLYKLESSHKIGQALGAFLCLGEEFQFVKKHQSENEECKFVYKQLREKLDLPLEFLECVYKNEKMRHFYSDDERKSFMHNWLKR